MNWLERFVVRLVPRSWRETVYADLAEEAAASRRHGWRATVWCAWQMVQTALSLRRVVTGDALMSDAKYALRSLLRARWFTVGAIVTFALGIGVNLAVFSAVDRMLFRPLPYGHADRLVLLRECSLSTGECAGSMPSAVAYAAQGRMQSISEIGVAGFSASYKMSPDAADDDLLRLVSASPNLLEVLQVSPALGHQLSEADRSSHEHVAWIRDETWRTRFGADPDIVGRIFGQGDRRATIIGVLPRGFLPPAAAAFNPKWDGLVVNYDDWSAIGPTGRVLVPVARLRDGMSVAAAQTEVDGVVRALSDSSQASASRRTLVQAVPIERGLFSRYRRYLQLVAIAAGLIFLVTTANLAALLVARGRSRERQMAIRSALGASRARLVGSALVEALTLCLGGAFVSVGVLAAGGKLLRTLLPPMFAGNAESVWDLRVMAFAAAASVCSAVIIGVLPGWRSTRTDVLTMFRKSARGRDSRLTSGRTLLAMEAAFGCVLVLGALLALRSLSKLLNDDVGVVPVGLYAVRAASTTPLDAGRQFERYARVLDVVRQFPRVKKAGGSDSIAVNGDAPMRGFAKGVTGSRFQVTAGYLETLGVRLIAGRTISPLDVSGGAPVAVMSRSGAAAVWPDVPASALVGRSWQPEGDPGREIVGIVDDVKGHYGDDVAWRLVAVYLPAGAEPTRFTTFLIRMDPGALLDARALQDRLTKELGDTRVVASYLPDQWDAFVQDPRFRAVLFSTLAITGLMLTVAGLFALASYEVTRRRAEMAIRLALGARPGAMARLMIQDVCAPVFIGSALGLGVGYWTVKFAQEFLIGVDGHDLRTYAAVGVIVAASALVAAWFPARRAARTDPAVVLRTS